MLALRPWFIPAVLTRRGFRSPADLQTGFNASTQRAVFSWAPGVGTAWQNIAATTPAVSASDPVRVITPIAGSINLQSPSDAARGVLEAGPGGGLILRGAGSSAYQTASAIDASGFNQVQFFIGYQALSDASQSIMEFGAPPASAGFFSVLRIVGGLYRVVSRGTVTQLIDSAAFLQPDTAILYGIGRIAAPEATLSRNGTQIGTITASQGTGNYSSQVLNILSRNGASLFANGRLASLTLVLSNAGNELTSVERANLYAYTNRLLTGA